MDHIRLVHTERVFALEDAGSGMGKKRKTRFLKAELNLTSVSCFRTPCHARDVEKDTRRRK